MLVLPDWASSSRRLSAAPLKRRGFFLRQAGGGADRPVQVPRPVCNAFRPLPGGFRGQCSRKVEFYAAFRREFFPIAVVLPAVCVTIEFLGSMGEPL